MSLSNNSANEDSAQLNSIKLYGTESLCFDKNDFMKKDFNVDTFVQIHQASGSCGLDVLRDDLGIYLKILRSAMIDLINRDYADFVNLSTNLTGLDRLIDALKTPLGQLREEVLSVEQLLSEAIDNVTNDLNRRHTINRHKSLLHCINQISIRLVRLEALLKSKGSESPMLHSGGEGNDLVDRLASEVNHLNFLVGHCEGAALLDVFKPRVESVCNFVEAGLERSLREGIQSRDEQLLLRTLRTYASLGTIHHAHQQVRCILRSHLEEVLSDSALKSDPRGLRGMYENALNTVKKVCDPLLSVSVGTSSDIIPGYSFMESSAWPEIVFALETRTPGIFNSGNPSVFHERYLQSMDFLASFEELLGAQEHVEAFRKSPELQKFLDQWNLAVYFQIRYQEIGQVLEASLSDFEHGLSLCTVNKEFRLASSRMTWESLQKCFRSEIFLLPLLHRFWKLSLLILSRHRTFVSDNFIYIKGKLRSDKSSDGKRAKHTSDISLSETSKYEKEKPLQELHIFVYLLQDIDTIRSKIGNFFSSTISPRVPNLDNDIIDIIKETLDQLSSKHLELKGGLLGAIEEHFICLMNSCLKQVADTPRIYRRTNKSLPASHQAYVANAFVPLSAFFSFSKEHLDEMEIKSLLERIVNAVSDHYRTLTFDVLSSVHKMEESLRKLKKARERGTQAGQVQSSTISDDDKIRMQIYQDVLFFGNQISDFGLDSSSMNSYSQLLEMVVHAKDGKFTH